jgi:hypothetical protein
VQPKAIRFAAAHNMNFEVSALETTGGTLVGRGSSQYAGSFPDNRRQSNSVPSG